VEKAQQLKARVEMQRVTLKEGKAKTKSKLEESLSRVKKEREGREKESAAASRALSEGKSSHEKCKMQVKSINKALQGQRIEVSRLGDLQQKAEQKCRDSQALQDTIIKEKEAKTQRRTEVARRVMQADVEFQEVRQQLQTIQKEQELKRWDLKNMESNKRRRVE